jgi:hypothetical protein
VGNVVQPNGARVVQAGHQDGGTRQPALPRLAHAYQRECGVAQSESESGVNFSNPDRFMTMRLDTPYHAEEMRFTAEIGSESLEMSSEEWRDLGCPEVIGIGISLPSRKPIFRA